MPKVPFDDDDLRDIVTGEFMAAPVTVDSGESYDACTIRGLMQARPKSGTVLCPKRAGPIRARPRDNAALRRIIHGYVKKHAEPTERAQYLLRSAVEQVRRNGRPELAQIERDLLNDSERKTLRELDCALKIHALLDEVTEENADPSANPIFTTLKLRLGLPSNTSMAFVDAASSIATPTASAVFQITLGSSGLSFHAAKNQTPPPPVGAGTNLKMVAESDLGMRGHVQWESISTQWCVIANRASDPILVPKSMLALVSGELFSF